MITKEHAEACKQCECSHVITANAGFRFVGCMEMHGKWITELKECPLHKWDGEEQEHD